jgi:hypothetical protein
VWRNAEAEVKQILKQLCTKGSIQPGCDDQIKEVCPLLPFPRKSPFEASLSLHSSLEGQTVDLINFWVSVMVPCSKTFVCTASTESN